MIHTIYGILIFYRILKASPIVTRRGGESNIRFRMTSYGIQAPFASNLYSLPSIVSVSLFAIWPSSFR